MRSPVSLFPVVVSLLFVLGCGAGPIAEPAPATPTDIESKVLSLLTVNTDGTVAIADEAKATELVGKAWPAAKAELVSLNQRIRSGQTKGFRSQAALAQYISNRPVYQTLLDATGQLNYTAASDPPDPKNPQCRDKCSPYSSLCCCKGWWVLCWDVCGCKP